MQPLPTTEVLIVGGGPAGLAASIALQQRGIGCAVVEARPPAIDKACGEGLMPDSRETLAELGVHLGDSDGHLFRGIRFENSLHRVDAHFPRGAGIGVRRPRLHSLLAARAEEAGARLLWSSRVQLPVLSNAERATYRTANINGQPIQFRWLIGADGQASAVRKSAGLDRARSRSLRFGFRTHYRIAPWSDLVEVHWGRTGQLYITPVAPDCVCIVYITRNPRADRSNILAEFPKIAARLQGAEIVSQQRGAVTASCKLHRVATGFVALIGDASGSADAITGEGLAISFRQAHALAQSIESGSLQPYCRAHRRIGKLPIAMGELMLTLDRWPALQVRAMRGFAGTPAFFQELLQAHMGEKSLASVLLRRGPRFGWSLLTKGAHA
ncbi:MAG TPA: NAD(P)/FAD-dependent oxidoreductase [Acidobacteriaceae bacterium]|jgi:2-polyprenyl-6-methoxyphenol hydroxylase-like FAD-dependent oxidoreductase